MIPLRKNVLFVLFVVSCVAKKNATSWASTAAHFFKAKTCPRVICISHNLSVSLAKAYFTANVERKVIKSSRFYCNITPSEKLHLQVSSRVIQRGVKGCTDHLMNPFYSLVSAFFIINIGCARNVLNINTGCTRQPRFRRG